jgi:hypothetical protein
MNKKIVSSVVWLVRQEPSWVSLLAGKYLPFRIKIIIILVSYSLLVVFDLFSKIPKKYIRKK